MFFSHPEFDSHEQLTYVQDQKSGLRAILAIHNRTLGPSLGGCRIWPYSNEANAITDVLRLSKGMTYKAAIAGLNIGGGKSVVLLKKDQQKTPAMMRALGQAVQQLDGRYIIAEDVGATPEDMKEISLETPYVSGLAAITGDPSPWTARGVFTCMEKAVELKLNKSLSKTSVSVKGLGAVGFALCEMLHAAGCTLIVSDIDEVRVSKAIKTFGATSCSTDIAHLQKTDVFSPCALGSDLNEATIPEIRACIVCGAANNQLATPHDDGRIFNRDILYCPDYLINAGGLINVSRPTLNLTLEAAEKKMSLLVGTLEKIVQEAAQRKIPTGQVADYIARQKFIK